MQRKLERKAQPLLNVQFIFLKLVGIITFIIFKIQSGYYTISSGHQPPLFSVVVIFNFWLNIWLVNQILKDQTSPSSDQSDWFEEIVIQTRPIRTLQSSLRFFWKNGLRAIPFLLGLLNIKTVSRVLALPLRGKNLEWSQKQRKNRAE